MSKNDLIEKIQSTDPNTRGDAWQGAADAGPRVLPALAELVATGELEVSRAAKRAMWKIARYVGRPGADEERAPVVAVLTRLLGGKQPTAVRREVLWMLSELADEGRAVRRAARLLADEDLREDARTVLERIPGEQSLSMLRKALEKAPDDFKPALAQSLRARGVDVRGFPCRKLIPTRATTVKVSGV